MLDSWKGALTKPQSSFSSSNVPMTVCLGVPGLRKVVRPFSWFHAHAVPRIVESLADLAARESAFYGAWLCGTCLGAVGMSLHHKLCHTLGGSFNMPHAETHTIILPHVLAYNAPSRYTRYYEEVSDGDATNGLSMLLQRLKVKRSLKDFGFKEEDIDKSAEIAVGNSYWNPRTIESSLSGSC
ncbi:hypothetical protein VE00_07958 [Pseudogymnoascus sp. WSF 3629]|nr:hypothetical protein VE00_07958 [Pseudogymnoascus sp. WSF 3629]